MQSATGTDTQHTNSDEDTSTIAYTDAHKHTQTHKHTDTHTDTHRHTRTPTADQSKRKTSDIADTDSDKRHTQADTYRH